jgi:hypothetical protein
VNKFSYNPNTFTAEYSYQLTNKNCQKASEKQGRTRDSRKNQKKCISTNIQSLNIKNEISFEGDCSKIINEKKNNEEMKTWKIVDFDYEQHRKLLVNLNNNHFNPKNENKLIEDHCDILLNNPQDNKIEDSQNSPFEVFELNDINIENQTNNKLNEILNSTGNLNHNINNKRFLQNKKIENLFYEKNNFELFSKINSNLKNTKLNANNYSIPNKTWKNFALKNSENNFFNNQNQDLFNNFEENTKENIKSGEIENIMKKVLENSKKENASKSRDFLNNFPQNYMNLAKSQQKFYINNNMQGTRGERPTTSEIKDKNEFLNFFEFNLNEKNAWKKHEEFWVLLAKKDKNFKLDINEKLIEKYILPPNDEDILISYYCRSNNINEKFCIDENLENPIDEIIKWKNSYKKVVMRWHPDKLNPVLDSINLDEDIKIKLNKKAGLIIHNMNKNLKFIVGLLKRIIVKRENFSKNNRKN